MNKKEITKEITKVLVKEYNKMLYNNWESMYILEDRLAYYYNKYEDIISNDEKVNLTVIWLQGEIESGEVTDNTKGHCVLAFAESYCGLNESDKYNLFSFNSEYNRFNLENPFYTEKDGYNHITDQFVDIKDYRENYEEFMESYGEEIGDYPFEEYAKDNGYMKIEEYIKDYYIEI